MYVCMYSSMYGMDDVDTWTCWDRMRKMISVVSSSAAPHTSRALDVG